MSAVCASVAFRTSFFKKEQKKKKIYKNHISIFPKSKTISFFINVLKNVPLKKTLI
jgi:hypothetical protein